MSGNVWEWTHSIFKEYPYQAKDGREGESLDDRRVLRGGSFGSSRRGARCAYRGASLISGGPIIDKGLRVVASIDLL